MVGFYFIREVVATSNYFHREEIFQNCGGIIFEVFGFFKARASAHAYSK
jgi:hypothetical protein